MQDKKTYNEATDGFSRYMKDRLAEHCLPVDEGCWNAIEQEVTRKPSHKWLWWVLAPTVAALMAGLIWLLPLSTDKVSHERVVLELKEGATPYQKELNEPSFPETESIQQPTIHSKTSTPQLIARNETISSSVPEVNNDPDPEVPVEPEAADRIDLEEKEEQGKNGTATITPEREEGIIPRDHLWEKPQKRTSRKQRWTIGTLVSSSANFSGVLSSSDYTSGNDMTSPGNPGPETPKEPDLPEGRRFSSVPSINKQELIDRLKDEDFSDVSYSAPISVGITVRKELNDYLSLESGLVYTYLHTRFEQRRNAYIRAQLGLHYLGVPVNLVGTIWHNDKWDVYLSGGFMAEKGLKAVYSHEKQVQQTNESVSFRTSIRGMQWSLNMSVGFSYRIYDNWSLYAEPRLSYYFDNDQPASVRTDKSRGIGIGAGVRYTF